MNLGALEESTIEQTIKFLSFSIAAICPLPFFGQT
jgi:hypothetical protein